MRKKSREKENTKKETAQREKVKERHQMVDLKKIRKAGDREGEEIEREQCRTHIPRI